MQTHKNNFTQGKQALIGIANGVNICANAVRGTMGSAGKNVVIASERPPFTEITNDGAYIIQHLWFENPLEKRGHDLTKELVDRSNKTALDGSTATVLMFDGLLQEGLKVESSMELKESIEECLPLIKEKVYAQKTIITFDNTERIEQLANTASENPKFSKLIAEIYSKIGKDGIIQPEYVLGRDYDSYDFIQGVRFANSCGYLSQAMVHDEEAIKEKRKEIRAVYENPVILVSKRKIANFRELNPAIKLAQSKQKDLVIFTDDMDSQTAQIIIANHQLRKEGIRLDLPRVTIIKAPILWKDFVFEDFSKCVGATVVCDPTGVNFKNIEEKHFGTCDKIIIDKDETVIIGTKDISEHVAGLQAIVESGNDNNDDALRRIGWLSAKTVLLKVGGMSDTELSYRRFKVEDTLGTVRTGLSEGITIGGGMCLYNVIKDLPNTLGGDILKRVLEIPARQITTNARVDFERIKPQLTETKGYNSKSRQISDLLADGVVDSVGTVFRSIQNAISIASTALTIDGDIDLPPKEKQLQIAMPMMPNQM